MGVENKNKREISYMCIVGNDTRDDNVCTYSFIKRMEMNGRAQNILKYLYYILKLEKLEKQISGND